jgi:hypothetical protein
MKDFVDSIPFFQSYAVWIRWLIVLWLIYSAALAGILLLSPRMTPPEQEVSIDDLRLIKPTAPFNLTLDFLVRNALPQESQLVELKLAFYGKEKPRGGLQSFNTASAIYLLSEGSEVDQLVAGESSSSLKYETQITFPYEGQDYAEVSIPIAQRVSKKSVDRFIVQFQTDALPKQSHRNIEAVVRYDGKRLTKTQVVELKTNPNF